MKGTKKRSRRRIPDEDSTVGEPVEQESTEEDTSVSKDTSYPLRKRKDAKVLPLQEPKDSRGFAMADSIDGFNLRELDNVVEKQKDRNVFFIAFSIITCIIVAAVFIMMVYFPPKDENDPEMVFFAFIAVGTLISFFIVLIANWYRNRKKDK